MFRKTSGKGKKQFALRSIGDIFHRR